MCVQHQLVAVNREALEWIHRDQDRPGGGVNQGQTLQSLRDSINVHEHVLSSKEIVKKIQEIVDLILKTYRKTGKVLLCGNGGSAADAQHISAELSGKFYLDRPPLFAEALHVNSSYLTAVANDYSYDLVFSRLVESKGVKGDILIGISTSGRSRNVYNALTKAKELGISMLSEDDWIKKTSS